MDLYNYQSTKINYPISQDLVKQIYDEIKEKGFDDFVESKENISDIFIKAPFIGYVLYQIQNQDTRSQLQDLAEKTFNIKMHGGQITFARYTNKSGGRPILHSHYDKFGEYPTLAMSIQLNNRTKDWQIKIDDSSHYLARDRAVTYSGTHQIHSRPTIEFTDEMYCDVILCQFFPEENGKPVLIENVETHNRIMNEKLEHYNNLFPNFSCTKECYHQSDAAPDWETINNRLVEKVLSLNENVL